MDVPSRIAHYRVEEKLGQGAMGVVFRAFDTRLERPVALKLIADGDDSPAGRARTLREARASSALNHPNICTVYDAAEEGAVAFIVLELVDGESLSSLVRRRRFDAAEVLAIGRQIADALAHAHARGVVHRDLKCGNVVLTSDGKPKVLDFGLAAVTPEVATADGETVSLRTSSTAGMIVGTLPYMSPEVLRGNRADAFADLWALGVMIFEMTTGRLPFTGRTPFEVSAEILSGRIPEAHPDTPSGLRDLVHRALALEQARRFPDAESFRDAIGALVNSGEEHASDARPTRVRSLAVLPLQNLSNDPGEEYFADGMTEAITTALASVRDLRVVSRTSAIRFKDVSRPLPDIARALRVDAIVEGAVLRSESRVRVSVRLIHADADELVWAGSYDRELRDVLTLQLEVSRAVVNEIEVAVSAEERARLDAAEAIDPEAYEAYMRGRHALGVRTSASLVRAIGHFESAIDRAPGFAPALASLAECHNVLGFQGGRPPRDSYRPAGVLARRALELAPDLAPAYVSLGYTALHHDQRWQESQDAFRQGLRLDPGSATGHHWYALFHASVGHHELAVTTMASARDLDPLSSIIGTAMGLVLQFACRFDEAIEEFERVLSEDPGFWAAVVWRAMTLTYAGEPKDAMKTLLPVLETFGRSPVVVAALGEAAARAGDDATARSALAELRGPSRDHYVRPYDRAKVLIALGEPDAALAELELALAEGGNWLNYLRVDRAMDALRDDDRFCRLLADVYRTAPDAGPDPR